MGLRLPVHATALGKCLLAQLDDDAAREAAGDEPYETLTPRTVTSWDKLRAQLERVRREGVAHSRDEYELGLSSIAVPLTWVEGDGPVAVNISLPVVASRPGGDAPARARAEEDRGGDRMSSERLPSGSTLAYEPRPPLDGTSRSRRA